MAGKPGAAWLMAIAAALGALVSLYGYLVLGSGIDHTPGALLVLASSALLAVLGVVLARLQQGAAAKAALAISLLDILGTGFAGWLLHARPLIALMAICLLAWLARVVLPGRRGLDPSPAAGA